jgi:Phage tail lysozyme
VRPASPVSSSHLKSSKAQRTGRHRAPSRHHRTVKIIAAAAPAAALIGGFGAYQAQAQTQPPDPVAKSVAAYHFHALPSDRALAALSATPADTSSAQAAGKSAARRSGSAAHRSGTAAKAPAASPSASAKPPAPSPATLVAQDLAKGNNLLAVAQYLVNNGYSAAAAAGVASCVDGESGGNPESVGSGGGGLIGWTPLGSAAPNANVITGNPAQDMMTQLGDILYYDSTEIGESLVTELNQITDPVAAADFFSENFEKPAVTNSDVVPSVAEQVFAELGS